MRRGAWNISICCAVITVTFAAVCLILWRCAITHPPHEVPWLRMDGIGYLWVAEGGHHELTSPFSRRVLYPGLAMSLSLVTGAPLRYDFFFLSLLSFSLLAYSLAWIFKIFGLSPWLIAVFLLTPFPVIGLEMGYMPDLFAAALTALCFLFLLKERYFLTLFTLAICYTARENTLVVCALVGAIAWLRHKPGVAVGALVVIALGTALGTLFVRMGLPNIHQLPDALYFMTKAPDQFVKNVLGFRLWVNTLPVGEPWIKFALPHALCWGEVRVVGICPFEWGYPAYTLLTLLTIFGPLPLLIWKVRHLKLWSGQYPFAVQASVWTGGIGYVLGTSLGDAVERLIGYGWPLSWIVVPYVIAKFVRDEDKRWLPGLYALIFVLAWSPEVLGYSRWTDEYFPIVSALTVVVIVGYAMTWGLLRRMRLEEVPRTM